MYIANLIMYLITYGMIFDCICLKVQMYLIRVYWFYKLFFTHAWMNLTDVTISFIALESHKTGGYFSLSIYFEYTSVLNRLLRLGHFH